MHGKILIVDDEPSVRDLCRDSLADEEYEVFTAASGEEAYQLAGQEEFDVVLADIRMPDMNGLDLLEKLKSINPGQAVIMFSGFGDTDVAVEAMKRGAYDYLSKPLIIDELKIILQKALQQNHLREENTKLKLELQESQIAGSEEVRAIPLLQNVPRDLAQELLNLGKTYFFNTNEEIVAEGDTDSNLYIILDGEVSVRQEGAELFRLGRGECYGEMNVFRQNLRSQCLTAENASQILKIDKRSLLDYFSKKEERTFKLFVFNVLNSVYGKYRKASSSIVQLERVLKE